MVVRFDSDGQPHPEIISFYGSGKHTRAFWNQVDQAEAEEIEREALLEAALIEAGHDPIVWLRE